MFTAWINSWGKELIRNAPGYEETLQNVDKHTWPLRAMDVFQGVYASLRLASYSKTEKDDEHIAHITGEGTKFIKVDHENSWHYRSPVDDSGNLKEVERVSLNVRPERDLVKKLDEFCVKHGAYYKTPGDLERWRTRHDPVTIYFYRPLTEEMKSELAHIATPHVRGDHLLGERIAEGVYQEKSPSKSDIMALIKRAEKLDPVMGRYVRQFATDHPDMWLQGKFKKKLGLSTGMEHAVKIILDSYEKFLSSQEEKVFRGHLWYYDWEISSYNGNKGKMLHMRSVDPQDAQCIERELLSRGMRKGRDFFNRTGREVVVTGETAQSLICQICDRRGIDCSHQSHGSFHYY